jgi:hypothetical protein|tara:strand:- start:2135 stop:2767 length:633 start_codon:yes stop_codon:yes gene_type:complete
MGRVKKDNRGVYSGEHKDKSISAWADQQGYKIKFTHQSTGHSVEFPGSVSQFQDAHASDQKMNYLYGEVDPITRTQNTMRKISFTFTVTNGSLEEARYNEQNLNFLICMMYPKRNTESINEGMPLVRIKGLNFIANSINNSGLAVYINQLVYNPNMNAGFIVSKGTGGRNNEDEIYPVQIDMRIEGDVMIDKYVLDDGQPLPSTYPTYNS